MKSIFFYGLFMDEVLLKKNGVNPSNSTLAHIEGYGLRIGERATLVESEVESVYGVIMSLNTEDVNNLYSADSVSDYIPEDLVAITSNNETLPVISYNLPLAKLTGQNKEYAKSLSLVAKKVGLPSAYVKEIEKWTV
jgi:AIG2-like family